MSLIKGIKTVNKKMADDFGYTLILIGALLVVAAILIFYGIVPTK